MRVIAPLLFLSFAVAPAIAQVQEDIDQVVEERYGHLEKGKTGFRETWVNPNTDWTTFDKLYLWDAEFQFRDVGPARRTRSTMMNTRQREFGISDEDRLKFEEVVSDIFVEEIQKARNFALVDVIGPNTLIIRGAVLDIISRVPPESIGMVDVYLASVGEATLVLELIDVTNGEVAAVVAERRAFQSHGGNIDMATRATSATAWAEVRRWARREAVTLRKELEKAIAGR
jgi:hypothetical protein